jgi:muramidase (phage lysozyme)
MSAQNPSQSGSAIDQLFPYLENPNVRSFLGMIGSAEGTDKYGYNTLFGGGKVESLADHPRQLFDFTETTGRPNKTTAAGRYQFLSNTWDEQAKKLGLPDFGERSQDLAAVNLLQERGILPDVLQGNWETAVKKSGPIWASLPSSPYPQPRQSNDFVMQQLNNPRQLLASATPSSDVNPPAMSTQPDFSKMSDEQLMAIVNQPATPDYSSLSDQQLMEIAGVKPKMTGMEVAGEAITNFPRSAVKYGKELYEAVTNPIETAKNIGMVAAGGLKNITPEVVQRFISSIAKEPGQIDQAVAMANAVGGEYAKRYGTLEGFKQAVASDPVSVLGDLSLMMTGGGSVAAKVPGLTQAGKLTAQAGRTIDPFNVVTGAVTKPLKLAGLLASEGAGFTTGAGGGAIREAAQSGFIGGEKANAFLEQLRSNAPVENVVNTAKSAVAEMRDQRANAYRSGMVDIKNDKNVLGFANIDKTLASKQDVGMYKGQVIQPSTVETWQEINKVVQDWKRLDPVEFHTPEGLDRLKMRIGDIRDNAPFGTPARNVADAAYNAIKNEINTQAPGYAKVMKDYELASNTLKDIESSLSLGQKAKIDTSVRKLQSIMRNNANTNYGRRLEQAQMLEGAGAETLMPQLAGQALSSWTPRSLQGIGSAITAAGSAVTNPAYLASLPLTMPRIVGEAAYYGGRTAGLPKRLADALKQTSAGGKASDLSTQMLQTLKSRGGVALDPYVLRMLATKLGQEQPEEQR